MGGADVAVGGKGISVGGTGVFVGGSSVIVAVGVAVGGGQISPQETAGGGVAPEGVPIPQTQPSTSPSRTLVLAAPMLEYRHPLSAVKRQ